MISLRMHFGNDNDGAMRSARGAWPVLVVVALCSCSRGGFEASGVEGPEGHVTWGGTNVFDSGAPLEGVNSVNMDWKPFPTRDGLAMWFVSDRPGGSGLNDIYVATRTDTEASFGNVRAVSSVNTQWQEYSVTFDSAGTTVFISTNRPGGPGASDIWSAALDSAFDVDSAVFAPLPNVNTDHEEWDIFLSRDDRSMYFNRDNQVFVAERDSPSSDFGTPRPLGDAINAGGAGNPSLTDDQLVLVFNSTRSGGSGESDIWYVTRDDVDQPFAGPRPVPGINTTGFDADPFVSGDGSTIYFARGAARPYDLFVARISD